MRIFPRTKSRITQGPPVINFELFVTHSFTIFSLTKTEAGVQQSIGRRPQKAPTARDSDAECKSSGLFFLFLAFLPLTVPTNRGLHYQQQQPKVLLLVEFQVRNIWVFFLLSFPQNERRKTPNIPHLKLH